MKNIIFITVILLNFLSFSQTLPYKSMPNEVKDAIEGESNPNIVVATTLAQINSAPANSIVELRTAINGLNGSLTPNANVTIASRGGYLYNIATYVGNLTNHDAIHDELIIDLDGCTVSGTFKQSKPILATNFGAKDDNLVTTDNHDIGTQLYYIKHSAGNTLIWNKKDTGTYWMSPSLPLASPFYPTTVANAHYIRNGKVVFEADMRVIPNNTTNSCLLTLYDGDGIEVEIKGKIYGDRWEHQYDQQLFISSAATSSGDVRLRIDEIDDWNDGVVTKSINELIALTVSNLATNKAAIISYINSDADYSDYIATDAGGNNIDIVGQAGVFYRVYFTNETAGATVGENFTAHEWGYGIVFGSNVNNAHVYGGGKIVEFHGDAINTDIQGNGTESITASDMTTGSIDRVTGVLNAGDTGFRTMTTSRNMPTPHLWFSFSPNSLASLDLKLPRYWVSFYDDSNNFIEKSPALVPYETYDAKPEWKKYKVTVDYNGATDFANFLYFFNSSSFGKGGIIENLTLADNRRQNISNPPIKAEFRNITYGRVGGTYPQWLIDLEDNTKWQIGNTFSNSTFKTALGGIIVKGAQKLNISGNNFEAAPFTVGAYNDGFTDGIYSGYGRDINIFNNYFQHRNNTIDIGTNWHHNNQYKGYFTFNLGGSIADTNIFKQTYIRDGQVTGVVTENAAGKSTPISSNNVFIYNEDWGAVNLINEYNSIQWVNNTFKFNDVSSLHFANASNFPLVTINDTATNIIKCENTIPDATFKGTYTNHTVTGLVISDSYKHKVLFPFYAANNRGAIINVGVEIQSGFPKSFTIEDMKTDGALSLRLDQYGTDGIGTFETITIRDSDFTLQPRTDATKGYLVNSFYGGAELNKFLKIAYNKNINVEFINCKFESKDVSTGYFMYLGHRGTTLFKDCNFIAPTAEVVNFTSRGATATTSGVYRGTNNGAITMIGNRGNGNITFTMDTGDTNTLY
jgi:hypothetical protein